MSVEQEIKNGAARFEAAFNRGDAAAIGADYAEDALLLPPESPAERGRCSRQGGRISPSARSRSGQMVIWPITLEPTRSRRPTIFRPIASL